MRSLYKLTDNFVLTSILIIIYSLIFPIYYEQFEFLTGELGIIEISQAIILFISLLFNFYLKSKLRKTKLNEFIINSRIFLFAFYFMRK